MPLSDQIDTQTKATVTAPAQHPSDPHWILRHSANVRDVSLCARACENCARGVRVVQRFARCLKLVTHVGSDLVVNARPTRSHRRSIRSDQLYNYTTRTSHRLV